MTQLLVCIHLTAIDCFLYYNRFFCFIPRMCFRTRHFRTRHVKDQSRKPWQDYLCQEVRFLLQGLDEHTAKRQ